MAHQGIIFLKAQIPNIEVTRVPFFFLIFERGGKEFVAQQSFAVALIQQPFFT